VAGSQTKKTQDCDDATLKTCFLVYQGIQEQIRFADSKAAFETFTLNVYSLDVRALYRKLQEAATQLKGNVRA
jgi:hypothetical protein